MLNIKQKKPQRECVAAFIMSVFCCRLLAYKNLPFSQRAGFLYQFLNCFYY